MRITSKEGSFGGDRERLKEKRGRRVDGCKEKSETTAKKKGALRQDGRLGETNERGSGIKRVAARKRGRENEGVSYDG